MAGRSEIPRFSTRKLTKRPVCVPLVQGKKSAPFGGYISLEEIEEDFRQAELESLEAELNELLQSGNEELKIELGVAKILSGKTEEALNVLTTAEQQLPENALAPYALARCLMEANPVTADKNVKKEGRWSTIVGHLRTAIQFDPDNIPAHYHLGNAIRRLVEEESYVDAIEVYSKYLQANAPLGYANEVQTFINEQDPETQREAAFLLGQEKSEQQNYPDSISAFTTAAKLGKIEAYYHLGKVYALTGAYGKAVDAYQQAMGLGLNGTEVKEAYGKAAISMFCQLDTLSDGLQSYGQKKQDARIYNVGRGILGEIKKFLPHQGEITTTIFTPDSKTMVSGATDGYVKFWDIAEGTISENLLSESLSPIAKISYAGDGKYLLIMTIAESVAGNLYSLTAYDSSNKEMVGNYTIEDGEFADFIFVNGKILLAGYDSSRSLFWLKEWDFLSGKVLEKYSKEYALSADNIPRSIYFSDDDNKKVPLILTTTLYQSIRNSPSSLRMPFRLNYIKENRYLQGVIEEMTADEIITFSEDCNMAVITNNKRQPLKLLNLISGVFKELTNIKGDIRAVCFSPENDRLLTVTAGKMVTLWKIQEKATQEWTKTTAEVRNTAFSPSGEKIVLGLKDNSISLVDLEKGEQISRFPFEGFPGWQPNRVEAVR